MIAGFYRGVVDTLISRFIDVMLAFRYCCLHSASRPPAPS